MKPLIRNDQGLFVLCSRKKILGSRWYTGLWHGHYAGTGGDRCAGHCSHWQKKWLVLCDPAGQRVMVLAGVAGGGVAGHAQGVFLTPLAEPLPGVFGG